MVVGDVAAGSVLRTAMPAPMLPTVALASGVVPIALHVIVVPDAGADSEMPSPSNRRKMKPLITVPVPPETVRPDVAIPAPDPRAGRAASAARSRTRMAPGCVVASSDTCSVIAGRGDAGEMVCAPEPGIANVMASAPGFAFASRMAWRSEP